MEKKNHFEEFCVGVVGIDRGVVSPPSAAVAASGSGAKVQTHERCGRDCVAPVPGGQIQQHVLDACPIGRLADGSNSDGKHLEHRS